MRTRTIIISILSLLSLFSCISLYSQEKKKEDSHFKWGIRGGVNAISTSFYDTYYDGQRLDTDSYTNKAGYGATGFAQIYLSPFLIQPEVSWNTYREGISFILPESSGAALTDYNMTLSSNYWNITMLLGYSVINDDPYIFNLMVGTSFRANYHTKFKTNHYNEFTDKDMHYNYLGIIGLSFSIDHAYFDIRYEFNFPNTYIHFDKIGASPREISPVSIKKNENIISFSFGFIF